MESERWQRLKTIYQEALDKPEAERKTFVHDKCEGDEELEAEITRLLSAGSGSDDIDDIVGSATRDWNEASIRGQRVGPYRLMDVIGQGGMGQVYLAERADDEFEQRVAIKMANWLGATPEQAERFRLERQILANLEHPNIARLLDGGRTETGAPYLVMEYVDGQSIVDHVRAEGLTLGDRIDLVLALCDAVQYAHRKLVVHRDIKPSNVLVTSDGTPKLLDFGIAKLMDPVGDVPVTREDVRIMTPEYASPEQMLGDAVTTSTDVYGLGLLLYRLLTDSMPFDVGSRTSPEIRELICNTEPTLPSRAAVQAGIPERASRLEGDLDNIIMMALRKDPARRYASVGQFADDLRAFQANMPVRACGDSWGYRASKFVRRHRAAVVTTVAVVATVSLLTLFYTMRLADERNAARLEAARAEEVARFLTGMFAEANPRNNLGEPISARQMLDVGATRINDSLNAQPELQAALMVTIGKSYLEMWENKAARDYLQQAVDVAESSLGSEHPDVLRLKKLLGISMTELGETIESQAIHEANYAIQVRTHGSGSLAAATELRQLAVIDNKLGKHERAEARFIEAIDVLRHNGDAALDELAAALLDYGSLLRWLDRGDEEEPLLVEALAIREQRYGTQHPDYAAVVNNLGNHYFRRGEVAKAGEYMQEHVNLQRKLVGDEGVPYGNALANFSSLQLAQGKIEVSLATLDEAIGIFAKGYGSDSIPYAFALENKANILMRLSRYDEADPLFQSTLAIIGEQYGEDHKEYAFTQSNYGGMLLTAGRHEDGEVELREAVAKFSSSMSTDYSRTMLAQTKLAQCLWPQGKLDEALEVALAAEQTARSTYAEPHSNFAQALRVLAVVHRERADYEKADALFRETIAAYEELEEREVDWVTKTEILYADSLLAQSRYEDARSMLERRDALLASDADSHAGSRGEVAEALARVAAVEALGD